MRVLVFAAALALIACTPKAPSQPAEQAGAATISQASAPSGKPDAEAPAATTPILDREFLVGRWGDNGDCTQDLVLNGDGSFQSYSGGEGVWSLEGNRLRMTGKADTLELELDVIDQNTLRVTNPNGSVGSSQRCT